jgi:hypothetical protein
MLSTQSVELKTCRPAAYNTDEQITGRQRDP